jgi:hypothetical protein
MNIYKGLLFLHGHFATPAAIADELVDNRFPTELPGQAYRTFSSNKQLTQDYCNQHSQ